MLNGVQHFCLALNCRAGHVRAPWLRANVRGGRSALPKPWKGFGSRYSITGSVMLNQVQHDASSHSSFAGKTCESMPAA